ncbi:SCO family protein [Patiriisocius marinus]|uniref:Photosynthetic protein synthase II n=1 Tax=Patiriisocius marinus TaxID=1397112 RepID=A0A5J4IUD3_9FLAO|nr:SCO family protein [Patiriisocius marinus]GER58276.1 photosynthetic protein synthase II [Patiriisocius marinus]
MKTKYIGLAAVILIFAVIFIPRIHDRIKNGTVVDDSRSGSVIGTAATDAVEKENVRTSESDKSTLLSNEELEIINLDKEANSLSNESTTLETLQQVPNFSFINQNGETITNNFYKGKVYVVEFFFSTCPSICPIMNTNMLKVEEQFLDNSNFGIASISIDPEYDTVEVLKEYADGYEVSHPNWNFLTGDKQAVLKLSNEGFNLYAAKAENEADGFEHSGLFALIDAEGNVRSRKDKHGNPLIYYNGLEDKGVQMLIEDIKKLL